MIRRKYANIRIYEDNIDFADVENTITYSLSAKNLENNLNKREEELCNKIADLEAKLADLEHRLSNCIELPKYEKGQKIYYICGGKIEEAYFQRFNNWITAYVILNPHEVTYDDGYTDVDYDFDMVSPEQMFKTEAEAEAKLKKLKGKVEDVKD